MFKLFRDSLYIWYGYKTNWLNLPLQTNTYLRSVDNRLEKPSAIGTKLQVMSQNISFIRAVLLLLAYGGSSGVGSLQLLFSHLVDDSIANGGNNQCVFPVDFGVQCRSFPDDQHAQKQNCAVCVYFHGKLYSRS
jgi:hypothetical protein